MDERFIVVAKLELTLNTSKTLEGFDFQFNPGLNRQQILRLPVCD